MSKHLCWRRSTSNYASVVPGRLKVGLYQQRKMPLLRIFILATALLSTKKRTMVAFFTDSIYRMATLLCRGGLTCVSVFLPRRCTSVPGNRLHASVERQITKGAEAK